MYKVTLINQLSQFGLTEFDAIIEDDEGILPSNRLHVKIPYETPTQEDIDKLTLEVIAIQTQLNYSKTQEAIDYFKRQVEITTEEIINTFLSKDLDLMREASANPDGDIVQAVGFMIQGFKQAADMVLSQFPDIQN